MEKKTFTAILKRDFEKIQISEESSLIASWKKVGIGFACEEGICGCCLSEVVEGMGSLSTLSPKEIQYGVTGNDRLLCQCKISGGTIKVLYEY